MVPFLWCSVKDRSESQGPVSPCVPKGRSSLRSQSSRKVGVQLSWLCPALLTISEHSFFIANINAMLGVLPSSRKLPKDAANVEISMYTSFKVFQPTRFLKKKKKICISNWATNIPTIHLIEKMQIAAQPRPCSPKTFFCSSRS